MKNLINKPKDVVVEELKGIEYARTQGVSLCCLYDYLELFKGIPLDTIAISSSIPSMFTLAGLYLAAKKNGFDTTKLRGSVIQSPFFFEECGYTMHLPFPLRLRLTLDSIEFCLKKMPKFHSFLENPISSARPA